MFYIFSKENYGITCVVFSDNVVVVFSGGQGLTLKFCLYNKQSCDQ